MRSLRGGNFWGGLPKRKILLSSVVGNRVSGDGALALGAGYLTRSVGTADRPAATSVLVRRHPRDRIVNVWLIFIVFVGVMITVADGLTRVSIFDREEAWNGPFEYVPYQGAFLFAGLTLPLMIGYARKARVSLIEGLFLWFAFNTTAYTRDFSYVRWPGAPLFVTDAVLLVLLLSIYLSRRCRRLSTPLPVSVLLGLFLGAGALSAARGFWGHHDAMLVLRDTALVVYALFLLVAFHLLRSWLSMKRAAMWFLLGAALNTLNGLAWFIATPTERRFVYPGIYILISLAGVLVAMAGRLLQSRVGWIFAAVMCLGLVLANARSLFVSLAILFILGLGEVLVCEKIRFRHLVQTLIAASFLVMLAAFLFLRTETGRDFAERSTEELASGVLNSAEDPNWQFRLSAWKEAWKRFEDYPLAGEGFGSPFTFELLLFENDPRPHNTFLTVLYKMGLIGFLPLVALLIYVVWRGFHSMQCSRESRRVVFLQIVLLTQAAFCLFGMGNLLLESPFLASLFWASMGLSLRIMRMLDAERSFQWSVAGGCDTNEACGISR